ncbi:RAB3A interacting protein [Apophysomyces sp. BC1034]|nr:RAB3A interacting protein [Apophysomyces sp. BC1015]KAG0182582.1 RAB3A interacting protein [Apophysomyces sp. BC1021]KAG0193878.1 RAB3A interacting protein [Apophysomyces sp. BC1034]
MGWTTIIKSHWFPPTAQPKFNDRQRQDLQVPATLRLPAAHIAPCRSTSSLSLSPLPTSTLPLPIYVTVNKDDVARQQIESRITRQAGEIRALKQELTLLNQKYMKQGECLANSEHAKAVMESELEELSGRLFEQANDMVREARHDCHAMKQTIERLQTQLSLVQDQLNSEQAQLGELRARFEADPPPAVSVGEQDKDFTLDHHHIDQFQLFLTGLRTTALGEVHRLPLIKQCLAEDVEPCLGPLKAKLTLSKIVDCLVHQPCFIERCRRRGHGNAVSNSCFACARPIMFRFRLRENDKTWPIDRGCRDRLVAVCNFYMFVRNVHDNRYGSRSVESLFWEFIQTRLCMFWARSGVHMDKDLSCHLVLRNRAPCHQESQIE